MNRALAVKYFARNILEKPFNDSQHDAQRVTREDVRIMRIIENWSKDIKIDQRNRDAWKYKTPTAKRSLASMVQGAVRLRSSLH